MVFSLDARKGRIMTKYVAVDIGGTQIKYGLIDDTHVILEQHKIDTQAHLGGQMIVKKVCDIVEQYVTTHSIKGVAISSAGMIDTKKGEVFFSGPQIPNYIGTNFKQIIRDKFDLPCEVDNDVNCAGLAEFISGSAKGASTALCLTIGTGIGGCLIVDGNVLYGGNYAACEVGYIPLKNGTFQELASTTALIHDVAQATQTQPSEWNGYRIFELAKQGDQICMDAIDRMLDYLAQGIAIICYVANPQVVVLGGGVMAQTEYIAPRLEKALQKHLIDSIRKHTKLLFAHHENSAGMLGAYYHFKQYEKGEKI